MAMLCKEEEFGAVLMVKLLSKEESEDNNEVIEGGGTMSSSTICWGRMGRAELSLMSDGSLSQSKISGYMCYKIKEKIYA